MQSERLSWTRILEIVGIFSIVGSLIFVGLQMKQDRDIAASENVLLVLSEQQAWTGLLAENAAIWINGNTGAELTAEEDLVYQSLAQSRQLRQFEAWFRNQRVPGGNPPETFAYEWATEAIENPGLMRWWRDESAKQEHKYEQLGFAGEPANLWRQTVNKFIEERTQDN